MAHQQVPAEAEPGTIARLPTQLQLQAELAAAGVPDPAAALTDLRYACLETCVEQLALSRSQLEEAGEGAELRAAFDRHAAALLRERPDLGAAWTLVASSQLRSGDYFRAQVVSGRG